MSSINLLWHGFEPFPYILSLDNRKKSTFLCLSTSQEAVEKNDFTTQPPSFYSNYTNPKSSEDIPSIPFISFFYPLKLWSPFSVRVLWYPFLYLDLWGFLRSYKPAAVSYFLTKDFLSSKRKLLWYWSDLCLSITQADHYNHMLSHVLLIYRLSRWTCKAEMFQEYLCTPKSRVIC